MKKPVSIQLAIPEPCTQQWNEMQGVQGGRHCTHCQKTVMDFSRMTDVQLLAYFQKPGIAACGRFTAEQLDRAISITEVPKSNWWARIAAGLLLALGLSKSAEGQSKPDTSGLRKPLMEFPARSSDEPQEKSGARQFKIKGILFDEKRNPIVNAPVTLFQQGKQEAVGNALTDFDGMYVILVTLYNCADVKYDLLFEYSGVERMYTDVPFSNDVLTVNGKINAEDQKGRENRITARYVRPLIEPETFRVKNSNDIEIMGVYHRSDPASLNTAPYLNASPPNSMPFEIKRVYGDVLPVGR